MTRLSDISRHAFGPGRASPVAHAMQAAVSLSPVPAGGEQPGDSGSSGGQGRVRRGIGAAISGMKTLVRNRQLVWFTFLTGLVMAGNVICQAAFWYMMYNLHILLNRTAWQFFVGFVTLFCLMFLLAGLVLIIPSKREGSASFFEGLSGAKKFLKAIILWSFILALAGMLLIRIFDFLSLFWFFNSIGYFHNFVFATLSQFPFNVTLQPNIFTEIPGYGVRSPLFWVYFGLRDTLTFAAINLFLFILTPFVVPLIVLGQKTLGEAVAGSFAMMKKIWAETAACAIFLGVIVYCAFLTYLLVQAAYGMFAPPGTVTYHPTGTWVFKIVSDRPADIWIALAILYDLALCSVAFIVATVGGIAALDLYTSAKGGQVTGSPEPEPPS